MRQAIKMLLLLGGVLCLGIAIMSGSYAYQAIHHFPPTTDDTSTNEFRPIELSAPGSTNVVLDPGFYAIWSKRAKNSQQPISLLDWSVSGQAKVQPSQTISTLTTDELRLEASVEIVTAGEYELTGTLISAADEQGGTEYVLGAHPTAALGEIAGAGLAAMLVGSLVVLGMIGCLVSLVAATVLLSIFALLSRAPSSPSHQPKNSE